MPVDGKLTETDYPLVAFVEQKFWEKGRAPTVAQVAEFLRLDEDYVKEMLGEPVVREYLASRSILNPLDSLNWEEGLLTPKQLLLANVLLNQADTRTLREKLEFCQVKPQQYETWLADPTFAKYVKQRIETLFNVSDWQVKKSLLENASEGDTQAQKLYFQLTGQLTERHEHVVNLDGILTYVAEIVSRYVAPEIMQLIAEDLEYTLQNGRPPEPVLQASKMIEVSSAESTN